MFALLRSICKSEDKGDAIIHSNNVSRINLIKKKNKYYMMVLHISRDRDGDAQHTIAIYDDEHDLRASVSRLLADLEAPIDRAVLIAKEFKLDILPDRKIKVDAHTLKSIFESMGVEHE